MDGRKGGPADITTLRPVNPQVRTCPGAPANFRLCAKTGREQLQQDVLTEFLLAGLHGGQVRGLFAPKNAQRSGKPIGASPSTWAEVQGEIEQLLV